MAKFDGSMKAKRWTIEFGICAQTLTAIQQVEFVLSALAGDAKREVELLVEEQRDKAVKVLTFLKGSYGEHTGLVRMRADFYTCEQQLGEKLRLFILCLQECNFSCP